MVYRAEQRTLGREAVIKVLRSQRAPALVERFLREAQLASRLDHPYAAHIYAFGAERDGLLWIAMERVRGVSLAHLLAGQPERRMAPDRFVPLLERICEVVHAAHDQGVVHRDLKPSNVMVVARAGRLLPKLLDFGVAKQIGRPDATAPDGGDAPALTGPGAYLGSPYYMAPEQWSAGEIDARTDVYALGVLAFEALTGGVPFRGASLAELADQHRTAPVPALPDELAALAPALTAALAKRPADRPVSALAFAEALRIAAGVAMSPDALPRLAPEVRRDAVWLPQPIADAVVAFEAARNPHQARAAMAQIAGAAARYLGIVALAACGRTGPGDAGDAGDRGDAAALVRELRHRDLRGEEWLALASALVRPWRATRDAYPVPELIDAVADVGFAALLATDDDGGSELAVRDQLVARMPALAKLIGALGFATDYQLVVPRATGGEIWMGPRRAARPMLAITGEVTPGLPVLVDLDGKPVLQLAPLIQVAAPAPGAPDELFWLAGSRGRGARLVAEPRGFERLDDEVWGWLGRHVLAAEDAADAPVEHAPYLGLRAFTEADAARYFGRERAADVLVNQLLLLPMVAVVGPSGSGKSSFVRAGVLPRLPAGWRSIVLRPGAAPLVALGARVDAVGPEAITERLRALAGDGTIVVVIDQLEELFTLHRDPAECARFAELLAGAARSVGDPVRVIVTLRDDFLVRVGELPALRDRLAQGLTLLATPAPEDLVRMLVEPARQVGYRFDDPELPRAMAAAVAGHPGALALLSFTAARLWELRDRQFHRLTRAAYDAIGGVEGALARHAEDTLRACATDQQRLVREAFRHLVTADGTRAVLGRADLIAALGGAAAAVIERLIAARLLVAAEGPGGEDQIEIVHEALLSAWPRLVGWRRDDADNAQLRDQLRIAAQQWDARGRPHGLLWRGDALDDYRRWRRRWRDVVTGVDLAFADASLADEARGRRIRRVGAALALGVLIAAAAGLAVLYRASRAHAAEAHDRLVQSYEEQGRRLLLDGEYLRALPYLAEAYAQGDTSTAERFLLARAERLAGAELAVYHHADRARAAAFRADGTVLSVADDGAAALWSATTGRALATLPARPGGPHYGKVSRDGAFAAIPTDDGVVIWDGATVRTLPTGRATRVAIDGDGKRIAVANRADLAVWDRVTSARRWTQPLPVPASFIAWVQDHVVAAGTDHRVRLFGANTVTPVVTAGDVDVFAVAANGLIITLSGSTLEAWTAAGEQHGAFEVTSPVETAALSSDGAVVALGGKDGVIRIHDVETGAVLAELIGHRGRVASLALSGDGTQLASAGADLTLRVWDVASRRQIVSLLGAREPAISAALQFDTQGRKLLAPSADGTIPVYATGDPEIVTSVDAGEEIDSARYFDRGRRFMTSSAHALQLWSVEGERLGELPLDGGQAEISPDGRLAIVLTRGSPDAVIEDVATGAELARIHDTARLRAAAFARQGNRVITASNDGAVEVWSIDGTHVASLRGHAAAVLAIDPGVGDRELATASSDLTARIWDLTSGREIGRVAAGDYMVSAELVAHDTRLLTGSADRQVRLWDIATRTPIRTFEHVSAVRAASINADGSLVAGATSDGVISVWDVMSSSLVAQFRQAAGIESVMFAPAGDQVLSAGLDHRAVIWRVGGETRDAESVTGYVRCHIPYRLVETRLEYAAPSCDGK